MSDTPSNDDTPTDEPADDIGGPGIDIIEIQEEMEQSFLDYSMSVIVSRALPDVRDGLKPVHRRILWAMNEGGLRPDRSHVKCATVVGDVLGKYHPHGDTSVYDALVRLGQDFSVRHTLIDPHGNFGSPSDPPAAYRYCVTGDTLVQTTDGTVPIAQVAETECTGETEIDRKVLDRSGTPVRATRLFDSGVHPTLRLRTREGFELSGTGNHPVLVLDRVAGVPLLQWRLLEEIQPGERVVVRREHDPVIGGRVDDQATQAGLLAGAWVSEGFASAGRAGFNNTDSEYFEAVLAAFDLVIGGARYVSDRRLPSGRILHELDVQHMDAFAASPLVELVGDRSATKRVPDFVWAADPTVKQAFLQALFEGDGSVVATERSSLHIRYSTRSRRLARELQVLLLEFGVVARQSIDRQRGEYQLVITNRRDALLFANRIGFFGHKQRHLIEILDAVPVEHRGRSGDDIPYLADYLRAEAGRGGLEWLSKHCIDRLDRWEQHGEEILAHIADPVARRVAEDLVEAGHFYATVDSVEDAGRQRVYSLRIDSDDHSFVTNGFVSHNTECRLQPLAMELLADIDEDTVDFTPNFDGRHEEPDVLPSRYPNLLVNGSQGIAVGMATNIPPHNLGEVCDAVLHLIDNPEATPDDLMEFVKGPDFPTGGQIMGRQGILDAYRTGRGSIKIRGDAEIVEGARTDQIVVTAIPYQTSVEQIEQKAADLVNKGELDGIREIRNESAKGKTRLVFELKKDAPGLVILNNLYKHSPLQANFSVNMVALVDGVPRTLNLRDALVAYLDHQAEVIRRRSEFRLAKARARAHIVEGLVKAIDMIDEIIALIRGSADRGEAREGLMAEPFDFSEEQAVHILDMQLGRLTRLGRSELDAELAELRETIAELEAILGSRERLMAVISEELTEVREQYAGDRVSEITYDVGDLDIEDLIDDEELVVTLSHRGYVKTVAAGAFRTQGRGGRGVAGAKLKDGDFVTQVITTTAHAYLLFFSNKGKVYRLKAHEIPMKDRTARGTAMVNLLPLMNDEHIQAIIDTRDYETSRFLFFATRHGQVKKTKFTEYDSSRRDGLIAIKLKDDDELVRVIQTTGEDDVFIVSANGQTIRFNEELVRSMGRSTGGVRGIKLKEGDEVVSCAPGRDGVDLLLITESGYGKRTKLDKFPTKGRGTMGVKGFKLTAKKGRVTQARMVSIDDEIILISSGGTLIRTPVKEISSQGRDAGGVRVMNLDDDETVAAVAPVFQDDDE